MESKLDDSHIPSEVAQDSDNTKNGESIQDNTGKSSFKVDSLSIVDVDSDSTDNQASPTTLEYADSNNTADLFIGDLPKELTEKDIADTFTKYGEVVQLLIKRAKVTKISLGYGFVKYKNQDDAINAYNSLRNGCCIDGKEIRVGWAQRNCKIHIGNLEPNVTIEDIHREFSVFGNLIECDTNVHRQSKYIYKLCFDYY